MTVLHGRPSGGTMYRTVGIILAGVFIAFTAESPRGRPGIATAGLVASSSSLMRQVTPASSGPASAQGVAAGLAAARGVPPLICAFAAQAVWGGGWGWNDAPSSPVASEMATRIRDFARE